MKKAYIKNGAFFRTYNYKLSDVIEDYVRSAMKDYNLSLPEREEDETDDDYEIKCLDDRHDVETDIAELAKYRFIRDEFDGDKALAFNKDFPEERFDELLGEVTWEKLSDLKDYLTEL